MVEAHAERFKGPAAHTKALYTNMGEGGWTGWVGGGAAGSCTYLCSGSGCHLQSGCVWLAAVALLSLHHATLELKQVTWQYRLATSRRSTPLCGLAPTLMSRWDWATRRRDTLSK